MSSPFKDIKLVEKKESPKKNNNTNNQNANKKQKPSSIVQGYDPNASFKDILASYEKTGNPYALPKHNANPVKSDDSFASILDKWENKTQVKKPGEYKRASKKYEGTKSFSDILASFDNPNGVKEVKKEAKAPVEPPKAKPVGEYKRTSEKYEGKMSFSDILSSFENPTIAPKVVTQVPSVHPEVKKEEVIEETVVTPQSFFKEKEADDEREADVTWSIFGDNKAVERPVVEETAPVVEVAEVKEETIVKAKSTYEATQSFEDILAKFESNVTPVVKEEPVKAQEVPPVAPDTFFKAKEADDERKADVTWSIFGDNKAVKRKEEVKKDKSKSNKNNAPKNNKSKSEVKTTKDFGTIFNNHPIKDFETILREKADEIVEKKKTLQEKRMMMPQVFCDIHGFTFNEASAEIDKFLSSAKAANRDKVAIICGKGLHSEDGIPVLKPLVIQKLDSIDYISEYYSPSERHGGEGALWIIFK